MNFALRGGEEHRNLRLQNASQLSVRADSDGREYVQYVEDYSKTNQGGLSHLKVTQKVVRAYANLQNSQRCIVSLFKKYVSLCPPASDKDGFYRRELSNPTATVWYSKQVVGQHLLQTMVSKMCVEAGITGYRTNHSLRATAASRLYQRGVDEQLIQEVTGHRSSAVRSYKRTSQAQKRTISDVLHGKNVETPTKTVSESSVCDVKKSAVTVPKPGGGNVIINVHIGC